jgi:p-cumate 2,3-dioxygenase subunit beta
MTALPETLLTRLRVEDFLFAEAELLDRWQLDEWIALYTEDCRYEIAPTGKDNGAELSPSEVLFLVADDRFRLEQRVIRMKKPTAHAEYPHSRTRHLYSNVRVLAREQGELKVQVNFATFRTLRGTTHQYIGSLHYRLCEIAQDGPALNQFRVAYKRAVLDLDNLVPQGKVTIFL